jgi:hypothetical protein
MDTFKTQFMMSDVRTYVTVDLLADKTFGCTLNLVDFFEGDEVPTDNANYDLKIRQREDGTWGTSRYTEGTFVESRPSTLRKGN